MRKVVADRKQKHVNSKRKKSLPLSQALPFSWGFNAAGEQLPALVVVKCPRVERGKPILFPLEEFKSLQLAL